MGGAAHPTPGKGRPAGAPFHSSAAVDHRQRAPRPPRDAPRGPAAQPRPALRAGRRPCPVARPAARGLGVDDLDIGRRPGAQSGDHLRVDQQRGSGRAVSAGSGGGACRPSTAAPAAAAAAPAAAVIRATQAVRSSSAPPRTGRRVAAASACSRWRVKWNSVKSTSRIQRPQQRRGGEKPVIAARMHRVERGSTGSARRSPAPRPACASAATSSDRRIVTDRHPARRSCSPDWPPAGPVACSTSAGKGCGTNLPIGLGPAQNRDDRARQVAARAPEHQPATCHSGMENSRAPPRPGNA